MVFLMVVGKVLEVAVAMVDLMEYLLVGVVRAVLKVVLLDAQWVDAMVERLASESVALLADAQVALRDVQWVEMSDEKKDCFWVDTMVDQQVAKKDFLMVGAMVKK